MSDVRGQPTARLAAEIAAAGGHHILFVGSPGAGKTMIAERLPGLLPPLTNDEAVTATMIHSAAGASLPPGGLITFPPFRAPHHSASMIAMVGGGSGVLRPGEASLAHGGVLFLDEVGEFMPSVLDALRQPLEEGEVRIARASAGVTLPARFLLVGATNPCPCGGGAPGACVCNETARARYLRRLSGPFLDRFDLRVAVAMTGVEELLDVCEGEPSAAVQQRVARVRELSLHRSGGVNARLSAQELDTYAPLTNAARDVLRSELERGRLTGRGYHRIRRVARTLADLSGNDGEIEQDTVRVALLMRTRLHEREVA
jgi:magnesium chelatase family protein